MWNLIFFTLYCVKTVDGVYHIPTDTYFYLTSLESFGAVFLAVSPSAKSTLSLGAQECAFCWCVLFHPLLWRCVPLPFSIMLSISHTYFVVLMRLGCCLTRVSTVSSVFLFRHHKKQSNRQPRYLQGNSMNNFRPLVLASGYRGIGFRILTFFWALLIWW